MKIQISWDKIEPEEGEEEMIAEKFLRVEKFLTQTEEDLKKAEIRISRGGRWGVEVKFDMQLPGRHVFAKETGEKLSDVVVAVREDVERQLEEYVRKMRRIDGGV